MTHDREPERKIIHVATDWRRVPDEAIADDYVKFDRYAEAMRERNEADRRAGAAERALEHARETICRNESWLRDAKESEGVPWTVSFDDVWAKVRREREEARVERDKWFSEALDVKRQRDEAMRFVEMVAGLPDLDGADDDCRIISTVNVRITAGDVRAARALVERTNFGAAADALLSAGYGREAELRAELVRAKGCVLNLTRVLDGAWRNAQGALNDARALLDRSA